MLKRFRAILAAVLPFLLATLGPLPPSGSAAAVHSTASAASGSSRASRPLLDNPDFERSLPRHPWMPAGWDTSTSGIPVPTVFFGRDSFLVHSGHWAVNIANMSTAIPLGHNWSQTLLVGPETWGKAATFKVWTRSNGLEGRAYIMAQAYDDSATKMGRIWGVDHDEALKRMQIAKIDDPFLNLAWKRTWFEDPMTEWVEREASIVVPPGTNVLFVRCGIMGSGQVLFDDASLALKPGPPVPRYARGENLFAEPGFEARGLSWDLAIPPFEGTRVEIDSTVAHGGRCSLRLSNFNDGLAEARIGAAQPFDGRALRGQRVRLSGWYKADSLKGVTYVKVYSHGLKTRVKQTGGAEMLSDTFDWKQLSIEYDVPEDAVLVWANLLVQAPATGTVWIDDGRFEVIGPSAAKAAASKPAGTPAKR